MNNIISKSILILGDLITILIAIVMAISIRKLFNFFGDFPIIDYSYIKFKSIYITLIIILTYSGIYTKRFDFWSESKLILRANILSFIIIFAGLALGQNAEYYSRSTLFLIFLFSSILIPILKIFTKKTLFRLGMWEKPAKIISSNEEFQHQLFEDAYLGYIRASNNKYNTIFIDSFNIDKDKLDKIIESNIKYNREIIFTPILKGYNFSQSYIHNFLDSRVNVFILENKLLIKHNKIIKMFIDYLLVISSFVFWGPLFLIIALIIKLEDPKGSILFKQKRLSSNGKSFLCYKFRSMYVDQSFMEKWLKDNPDEKQYYDKYHKYVNDPRITKVGKFLRRTSLDEIPQLLNVLKGEMSLVGPRPYMITEKYDIGAKEHLVLSCKPGITGLWQVSGRSDVDFKTRVDIDVWYMKNWSLWMDIIILLKTINTVLRKKGAS